MNKNELLDFLYYKKFPEAYRVEDLAQKPKLPLYRYLQALFDGSDWLLEDINGIVLLTDPEKCPDKFLPYLMQSFGLNYSEDIDPKYQRKLLSNVGILFRRRGTSNCVRYLVRVLADMDVEVHYDPDTRYLHITLLPSTMQDFVNMATSKKVITRYLQDFLPYYCKVDYNVVVHPQEMQSIVYHAQYMSSTVTYNVIPEEV